MAYFKLDVDVFVELVEAILEAEKDSTLSYLLQVTYDIACSHEVTEAKRLITQHFVDLGVCPCCREPLDRYNVCDVCYWQEEEETKIEERDIEYASY